MDPLGIGVIVAVAGNSIVALSLNCQKLAHNRNVEGTNYLKLPMWWAGMILMVLGEIGNFVAYGFAPAVVVAPLGAVSVIINGLLGRFCKFLDEEVRLRDAFGYFLAIGGAVLFVFFSPHGEGEVSPHQLIRLLGDTIFIVYFLILMILLVVVFVLSKKYAKKTCVVHLAICSILGSITVMATKAISTFVRLIFSGINIFTDWITYVLIFIIAITTTFQMRYLNMAMENFGAAEVVPVYYVMFTGLSILSGGILYHEFQLMSAVDLAFFAVGCMVTFSGVYFITSKRSQPQDIETPLGQTSWIEKLRKWAGLETHRIHPSMFYLRPLSAKSTSSESSSSSTLSGQSSPTIALFERRQTPRSPRPPSTG